ncbi:MAG: flagellar motor switch protein FliG [Chloroflexi bacterium]|jgi:flagellar motor switch protein FliG|nr:flagellar motor switch protein FliG [Chloroflexota bacterium]NCA13515.1 flagellar motor switch protein FliG [Pseudomonadota bacterium]
MAATAPASETTQEAAAPVPALPPPPTAPVRRGPLAGLTGLEQIAAFLIAVGEEASIAILKNMPEEAVEAIALEIHKMRFVQPDIVDAVLDEVADMLGGDEGGVAGGLPFLQQVLSKTLLPSRASEMLGRLTARAVTPPFSFLRSAETPQLIGFIKDEHPQTIALIIAYLAPEQAAKVLAALPQETQSEVAMRIAVMDRTQPEVVREVERLLRMKFSSVQATNLESTGGIRHIVSVLQKNDPNNTKAIMDILGEQEPDLADEIQRQMFVFNDIIRLGDRDMPKVVREVDGKDLALALRGASEELRIKFFKGMSSRSAAQMKDDIEIMGPQRLSTIEEAQQKVVQAVRRLEQNEEIVIARAGGEEFK